jgi:DNA-nicking Smr family endonuclease
MNSRKDVSESLLFQQFGDLKKIIATKGLKITEPKQPLPKKEEPPSDEDLFVEAMKEVREIREFRGLPDRRQRVRSLPARSFSRENSLNVLEEIVDGRRPVNLPDTQEYVEWVHQDFRHFNSRKLHEGRYSVQDCLDLHGFTLDEAETAVAFFLRESLMKGYRCIRIIHGRGLRSPNGPVLKAALVKWLSGRYRKRILAFASARQCDGGLGALYILLGNGR